MVCGRQMGERRSTASREMCRVAWKLRHYHLVSNLRAMLSVKESSAMMVPSCSPSEFWKRLLWERV